MNLRGKLTALAAISIASATCAMAQTPQPPAQTDPSAASSPHQRDSTSTSAAEAPATSGAKPSAASTPHQQEATETAAGTKAKHQQMMKDCVKKEQAKNSDASQDQLKKTCMQQMKSRANQN